MKKAWWYALLGIALWSIVYVTFTLEVLSGSSLLSSFPSTLLIQLFLFFIPGLIIALLFFEIGNIKNAKARNQSFWITLVLLILFFIFSRGLF